jgi:hypothetical protein
LQQLIFSIFSALRISLRIRVFFDDGGDHEIENLKLMAREQRGPLGGVPINYLKSYQKMPPCDFFVVSANSVIFCGGNNSKALAFCAARSHIVAVR